MKNTLIFILFVLVVLGLLSAISGKRVHPPFLPEDANHGAFSNISTCMDCHGPDRNAPLKKTHPPKHECFKCHKTKGTKR
jgi:hypothetical protein